MQIINNRFLSLYDYNFLIVNQMRKYWMWGKKEKYKKKIGFTKKRPST